MRCPNDDAELIAQTKMRDGIRIALAKCPICGGYWLDAFNANYIQTSDIERSLEISKGPESIHPVCPVCQEPLKPYHGENIPPNVKAWRCPNGDGYFFPAAQFFAFKKAQEAKLTYFKLWNIPLPSVASVLLVAIVGIISIGLVTTYLQYQSRQTTLIQAREIVSYQQAFVAGHSVTIAIATTQKAKATIRMGDFSAAMKTEDGLLHTVFLTDLESGTYQYYVTFEVEGRIIRSETYSFMIQ